MGRSDTFNAAQSSNPPAGPPWWGVAIPLLYLIHWDLGSLAQQTPVGLSARTIVIPLTIFGAPLMIVL